MSERQPRTAAPPADGETATTRSAQPVMTKPAPERRLGLTVRGWTIVGALVVILALELAPRVGLVDSFSLVPLSEMVFRAVTLLGDPRFLTEDLLPSLLAIGSSFVPPDARLFPSGPAFAR